MSTLYLLDNLKDCDCLSGAGGDCDRAGCGGACRGTGCRRAGGDA